MDRADISGGNQHDIEFFDIIIVPDAFGLSFDGVFHMQSGRVDHHFRGVFIQLKELLYEV